jgi:protocatechuate 3,4-dioxygenase beta subunit
MYLANPPQRSNFRTDAANAGAEPILLAGRVLTPDCKPIANARVDVWHTDAKGNYDMSKTYASRGYMLTDSEGRYEFATILPAIYTGRTAHIHVKITPPGGKTLTTQLYFPNEATNKGDAIFDPKLLVRLDETPQGKRASFDFVVGP